MPCCDHNTASYFIMVADRTHMSKQIEIDPGAIYLFKRHQSL